ncbi:hypothetical protein LOZ80_05675 [Paenibacillus sp. HWE-109]|uniref:hypothetical protein n=1 Tax=Paenibacillus sp. HWE-109 TaxID=1306526 RepID=UPI001EDD20E8|nr:hypothetical protein [Paenibacillus sp. HWE-109]UKS28425.1 hypothetical protein LOZ80_05675 [Paenibacillus sp. HWE-109]
MTNQIPDTFKYHFENNNNKYIKKQNYELAAIENEWPFIPKRFGYDPIDSYTASRRGFYCLYDIVDEQLVLKSFYVNLERSVVKPPDLNGVSGQIRYGCFWEYKEVNLHITYSGGIILCDELVGQGYLFGGYDRTHHFQYVIELQFEKGFLKNKIEHSETMKEIRNMTELDFFDKEDLVADHFSVFSGKWIDY